MADKQQTREVTQSEIAEDVKELFVSQVSDGHSLINLIEFIQRVVPPVINHMHNLLSMRIFNFLPYLDIFVEVP